MCESILTALSGEAALFVQSYECNSPVAPSDFDRFISGYRLIWGYRLLSRYRLTQTALYRDTTLVRPPYNGISPYSDRLMSGYRLI